MSGSGTTLHIKKTVYIGALQTLKDVSVIEDVYAVAQIEGGWRYWMLGSISGH